MNILAIGAHPDDLEVYCFGTLAKYVRQGHRVVTSSMANGDLGHHNIQPPELAAIRWQEAQHAAQLIGAEYIGLNIGDLKIDSHQADLQRKVVELIRVVKPDLMITHYPDDYMSDHEETSRLVFNASFASSIPHYKTATDFHELIVPIYYMESSMGIGFIPDEYVDITQTMDVKTEAIKCHQSQLGWLDKHDGFDMVHYAKVASEYRGIQSNVKCAEGFRRCAKWPRMSCQRLLP